MCTWYLISGTARLRRCPEVESILDELRDLRGDEFEVITEDVGSRTIELRVCELNALFCFPT